MMINLHGFNSAGNNRAAEQLGLYFEPDVQVLSPSYTVHNYAKGMAELVNFISLHAPTAKSEPYLFVGSSTGAIFAEMLAARYGGGVVAINPVTDPGILQGALGWNTNFRTQLRYKFRREDLDTFQSVKHQLTLPRLVLVEAGDPVIDHSLTRLFYEGVAQYMEYAGNSHSFSFFDEALPEIARLYARLEQGLPNAC